MMSRRGLLVGLISAPVVAGTTAAGLLMLRQRRRAGKSVGMSVHLKSSSARRREPQERIDEAFAEVHPLVSQR